MKVNYQPIVTLKLLHLLIDFNQGWLTYIGFIFLIFKEIYIYSFYNPNSVYPPLIILSPTLSLVRPHL